MLKQQLQKTEEEFDKEWLLSDGSLHIGGAALNELKQFIRQAQIDAVKAFAEEMTTHVNENYSRSSQPLNAHIDAKGVVDKINSLLKEINI